MTKFKIMQILFLLLVVFNLSTIQLKSQATITYVPNELRLKFPISIDQIQNYRPTHYCSLEKDSIFLKELIYRLSELNCQDTISQPSVLDYRVYVKIEDQKTISELFVTRHKIVYYNGLYYYDTLGFYSLISTYINR